MPITKFQALQQVLPDIKAILAHQQELVRTHPISPSRDHLDTTILENINTALTSLSHRYYRDHRSQQQQQHIDAHHDK